MGTGKLKVVQSFCCKVAFSNPNVHDGRSCKADLLLLLHSPAISLGLAILGEIFAYVTIFFFLIM